MVDIRYVVRRSIYIVQRPYVMFYTVSLRTKNMCSLEHACVTSASTTYTSLNQQTLAEVSKLARQKEPTETAEQREENKR